MSDSTTDTIGTAEATVNDRAATLVAARQLLVEWEGKQRTAADAVERLQSRVGEAVLEAPERAEELTRDLAGLRDQATIAQAAGDAQRVKLPPLERAYLEALGDLVEAREVEPARAAYDAHSAAVVNLVKQIEKLEGVDGSFLPAYIERLENRGEGESASYTLPKSATLQHALTTAEHRVKVIRMLADGSDPESLLNEWNVVIGGSVDYPAEVWGPQALVPARQYLASVNRAHSDLADAQRALDDLPAAYDAAADQARRGGLQVPSRADWMGWREDNLRDQLTAARTRLEELGQPIAG